MEEEGGFFWFCPLLYPQAFWYVEILQTFTICFGSLGYLIKGRRVEKSLTYACIGAKPMFTPNANLHLSNISFCRKFRYEITLAKLLVSWFWWYWLGFSLLSIGFSVFIGLKGSMVFYNFKHIWVSVLGKMFFLDILRSKWSSISKVKTVPKTPPKCPSEIMFSLYNLDQGDRAGHNFCWFMPSSYSLQHHILPGSQIFLIFSNSWEGGRLQWNQLG